MKTAFIETRHHLCQLPSGHQALVRARWEHRHWTFFGLLPKTHLHDFVIESCPHAGNQAKAEVKRQLLAQLPR